MTLKKKYRFILQRHFRLIFFFDNQNSSTTAFIKIEINEKCIEQLTNQSLINIETKTAKIDFNQNIFDAEKSLYNSFTNETNYALTY